MPGLGEAAPAAPRAGASAIASPAPPLTPDQFDEREFGAGPMLGLARLARGGDLEALERPSTFLETVGAA